jgi:predicted PurR-regulated permease PerM
MTPSNFSQSAHEFSLSRVLIVVVWICAAWFSVLALHLTPAVFAILITYGATTRLAHRLKAWLPALRHVEAIALLLVLSAIALGLGASLEYLLESGSANVGVLAVLERLSKVLDQLRLALPAALSAHVPASIDGVRAAAAAWLQNHASQLQTWGGHTLRGVGYVLAGTVIGALLSIQLNRSTGKVSSKHLPRLLRLRFDELIESFTHIVFAQFKISAINTLATAIFLLGVLPALGTPIPLAGTLVSITFVAGMIPIVGNLVSNTIIVAIALSQSLTMAILAFIWLVAIHKVEYFLNAHIIGSSIRSKAWELLLAMLVMEALFGLAGLVTAPVLYAQIKHGLYSQGWLD